MIKYLFISCCICLSFIQLRGQSISGDLVFKDKPLWIEMMNDTSENYFRTVEAFKIYYSHHPLPKEAMDSRETGTFERDLGLQDAEEPLIDTDNIRDHIDYHAEVRAFKAWFYTSQSWLREDGSITGPRERQAIIDQQQKELKTIEKSQQK